MISADELRSVKIFGCLEESERQRLAQKAADVRLEPGEWLIREGEVPYFFVLLDGQLQMVKDVLGRDEDLSTYLYNSGEFFGEVPILLGTNSLISLRAETACRVARFERQQFRELIRDSAACSATILQTMNERLLRVQKFAAEAPASRVLVIGSQYDTDCRDIRTFLAMNRIPYDWVDRATEPERVPQCMPKNQDGPAVVVDRAFCVGQSPTVIGKDVFIVGGGNSAGQAAMFFSNYANSVTMVVRGPKVEFTMSQYLVEQIALKRNITVETNTVVVSVNGEDHLESICTKTLDEAPVNRKADALFVMIGADASTDWLPKDLQRDERGYICTGRDVMDLPDWSGRRAPFLLETNLPGFFCAGDVRHESIKRVSSGVGEGSMAIAFIHQYLALDTPQSRVN